MLIVALLAAPGAGAAGRPARAEPPAESGRVAPLRTPGDEGGETGVLLLDDLAARVVPTPPEPLPFGGPGRFVGDASYVLPGPRNSAGEDPEGAPTRVTSPKAHDGRVADPVPTAPAVLADPGPAPLVPMPRELLDPEVHPAECASCGRSMSLGAHGHFVAPGSLGAAGSGVAACAGGGCVPGHRPCYPLCDSDTFIGRFFGNLYECLCCPDPCYEPAWNYAANSAFFVDYARPQTMQRIRFDTGINLILPDRAEFFWARADGKGRGPMPPKLNTHPNHQAAVAKYRMLHHIPTPTPPPRKHGNLTTPFGQPGLDYHELYYYTEAAAARGSVFVEIPYRLVEPYLGPTFAGFADMNAGTKSLLYDCELLQVTFQFRTYIPIGSTSKGLGTGHVSLEPSLLTALRLSDDTYLQGQLSEWIPLGGDPQYSGSLLHYHLSLNDVLFRVTPDSPLIGTLELNGWSFQGGAYTDPYRGDLRHASGVSYISAGPGLRMVVCNWLDFGLGTAFALSYPHWSSTLYRAEFRIRF